MNWRRGAFRIWVVLSLVWIAGVCAASISEVREIGAPITFRYNGKSITLPNTTLREEIEKALPPLMPLAPPHADFVFEAWGPGMPPGFRLDFIAYVRVLFLDGTEVSYDEIPEAVPALDFYNMVVRRNPGRKIANFSIPLVLEPWNSDQVRINKAQQWLSNAWQHERIAVEPRPPTREETIAHYRPRSMTVTLLRIGGIAASEPSVSLLAALTLAWVVRGFRRG